MISFNFIPNTIRTPGAFAEIDNQRALTTTLPNPHKALIIGQKIDAGSANYDEIKAITQAGLEQGYFGPGSILARMCAIFKENNPYTELHAIAIGSGIGGVAASAEINFSTAMYSDIVSGIGTYYLLVAGKQNYVAYTSGFSGGDFADAAKTLINNDSALPVTASASGGFLIIKAVQSGTLGNYINIRANYYNGQSLPAAFSTAPVIPAMAGGSIDPDLSDVWAVISGDQYHKIINPYIDAANLTELETELEDRFKPLVKLDGQGIGAFRATLGSCTTLGNSRNSPFNSLMGAYDSPTSPEEWAAAFGAQAAFFLNQDPARPLTGLKLTGILPPPSENRFDQSERNIILYDGIATWIVDSGGNVLIERAITTYQKNAFGLADPSYLDIQTIATLMEIRYQTLVRMYNRFIVPRMKLADDTFPVQPGSNIARPKDVRAELISLFTILRDNGLIENLADFIDNLKVERNSSDKNRVDALLPPDLINQFRIFAGLIQFIL